MSNEEKLRDALIRAQVYLEGVKIDVSQHDEQKLDTLAEAIIGALLALGVYSLSELTYKEFRKLLSKLRQLASKRLGSISASIQRNIQAFVRIERKIQTAIHRRWFEPKRELPTLTRLMGRVQNAIIPGTGRTVRETLGGDLGRLRDELANLLRMGYVDPETTVAALVSRIRGTRAKGYRDGWIGKAKRAVRSGVSTALQHAAALVGNMTGEAFFERYQWVSVLDERTTAICTDRDGKVYVYGRGPVPPAHYNCRSTTVPYLEDSAADWRKTNWFEWATSQPEEILVDLVGRVAADDMTADGAKASDFPRLTTVRRLSLANYAGKLNRMLND